MRKTVCILLSAVLLLGILSGCGGAAPARSGKLSIVATIFPEYDWVRQILGDEAQNAELTLLLDNGVDLHSFQPSVQDMVRIAECDLLICVGGASDKWIDEALANSKNEKQIVVRLLSVLGDAAREEELVEGMEAEEEDGGEAPEYDEHVWLSLKNAARICEAITQALSSLAPERKAAFEENARAYLDALSALDREYRSVVDGGRVHTLLFGDRFPFRYLTEDYALDYYAAFAGCSAETNASFETVAFLAGKLNELGLNAVLTIETGDGRIARSIVDASGNADVEILCLDSMQSVTAEDVSAGASYLEIMRGNLEILRQALQ